MYKLSEEQRKQLLQYMWTRPYGEVHQAANPANDTVMQCVVCNSKGEIHDKEFDEYFDTHPLLKSLHNNGSN
jgi:hypothetical protein